MRDRHITIRLPKRLVFLLFTLALVFALLEAGQRISDWKKLSKREGREGKYSFHFETASGVPLTQKRGNIALALAPYTIYRPRPGQRREGITVNAQGFRGRDWALEKPAGALRVVVLGGSACFGSGTSSDDAVFTAVLERDLNLALRARQPSDPLSLPRELHRAPAGKTVEVMNAGVLGFDSMQELVLLTTELLDYAPDLVVTFDGWNDFDISGRTPKDRAPVQTSFYEIDEVISQDAKPFRSLLGLSAFYRGVERKLAKIAAPAAAAPEFGPYNDHPQGVARYVRGLERIAAVARAHGAKALFVSQPELFQRKDPIPEPERAMREEAEKGYGVYARARYSHYVLAAKEAARAAGVTHIDATSIFDGTPDAVFSDWVHLNDRGNEVLAARLLPEIAQALGFPR